MKRKLYREVCVLISRTFAVFTPFVGFAYFFTIISSIMNLYFVFRYISLLHPFVLQIFVVTFTVLGLSDTVLNQSCVDLVTGQKKCLYSHRSNVSSMKNWETKHWKSFRPFLASIMGETFTIERQSFVVEVFWKIIVDGFVNLIITLR